MADGMRFDSFYANCPVCSPTRAALLSGTYPDLVGVPGVIRTHPENNWGWLSQKATLLPRTLKGAGYHTSLIGKWHLGLEEPNTPNGRGFDHFKGFLCDMIDDYYKHRRHGINYFRENRREIDPPGHATDLITEWGIDHVNSRKGKDSPVLHVPRLQRAAHADPAAAGLARKGEGARTGHQRQARQAGGADRAHGPRHRSRHRRAQEERAVQKHADHFQQRQRRASQRRRHQRQSSRRQTGHVRGWPEGADLRRVARQNQGRHTQQPRRHHDGFVPDRLRRRRGQGAGAMFVAKASCRRCLARRRSSIAT